MTARKTLVVGSSLLALVVAAGAALALAATPARAQGSTGPGTRFSSYIDDLPIMPGLSESDQGYAFDLYQGGRLAEARLSGQADAGVVRGFYASTLLQLGWKPSGADPYSYRRGRERLIFLVEPKKPAPNPRKGAKPAAGLDVMFVVTPDPEAAPTAASVPAQDDRALF